MKLTEEQKEQLKKRYLQSPLCHSELQFIIDELEHFKYKQSILDKLAENWKMGDEELAKVMQQAFVKKAHPWEESGCKDIWLTVAKAVKHLLALDVQAIEQRTREKVVESICDFYENTELWSYNKSLRSNLERATKPKVKEWCEHIYLSDAKDEGCWVLKEFTDRDGLVVHSNCNACPICGKERPE